MAHPNAVPVLTVPCNLSLDYVLNIILLTNHIVISVLSTTNLKPNCFSGFDHSSGFFSCVILRLIFHGLFGILHFWLRIWFLNQRNFNFQNLYVESHWEFLDTNNSNRKRFSSKIVIKTSMTKYLSLFFLLQILLYYFLRARGPLIDC